MGKVALEPSLNDGWDWCTWRRKKGTADKGHSMTTGTEGRRLKNRAGKGVVGNKPEIQVRSREKRPRKDTPIILDLFSRKRKCFHCSSATGWHKRNCFGMKDRLRKQAVLERERTGDGTWGDLPTQAPLIKYF